jgi:PhnB protein
MSEVNAVPKGFHRLTPHLIVRDSRKAIDFYQRAFGAEVLGVAEGPGGGVIHAALKIGDSMLMLNDEMPDYGALSPLALGGSPVTIHMYLENVDAAFSRAVEAGGTVAMPLADQFWGDRYGVITDPFGHKWSLATHVRDMSMEEMKRAQDEAFAKMPKSA